MAGTVDDIVDSVFWYLVMIRISDFVNEVKIILANIYELATILLELGNRVHGVVDG